MTALGPDDFGAFFGAIHDGREPFPWQQRLAERVCGGRSASSAWPRCIALPTAAGKTACIDIAVFALACQAALPPERRTAPRRIFFVVDRRVVVDQAYDHAEELAEKLADANEGVLHRVAAALRLVGANHDRPLDAYALRGGMYRDSAWVRSPLQPTVITSTVDQVGSRLLFRGYGVSDSSKPMHAALVGNDALILLDEAHCARPFDQTMTLVRKYREWTSKPEGRIPLPFHFVTMTATPGADVPAADIERLGTDDRKHPVLGRRIVASKRAGLVVAAKAKGAKWRDELVTELVAQTKRLQAGDTQAIGVIVNRVATARKVAELLRAPLQKALDAARAEPDTEKRQAMEAEARAKAPDIILLTGRMRPVDRDAIMEKLQPMLSNSPKAIDRPTFVVATQTIEVGADLDFHALVTACASLDALRQRFGRLNRVAARDKAGAVIVVRADQTEPAKDDAHADPVYGNSLAKTWQWLTERAKDVPVEQVVAAAESGEGKRKSKGARGKKAAASGTPASASAARVIDFGVEAMETLTKSMTPDDLAALIAPAPDAAVLLPAHLDMWCQTSPRPVPDPGPAYFLHGPQRGEPEVQVVFRADLGDDADQWAEIVSLCPPSSSEALSVRLRDFRRWLALQSPDERSGDVEGERISDEHEDSQERSAHATRRTLRWRGPDSRETGVIDSTAAITPFDTYVIPITSDDQRSAAALLGDFPADPRGTPCITDAGDEAFQTSRDKAILRLRHDLYPALHASFDMLDPETIDADDTAATVDEALAALKKQLETAPVESLRRALDDLGSRRHRTMKRHPLGGIVLIGTRRLHQFDPTFVEPEESCESSSDRPYPLDRHGRDVSGLAKANSERCGLSAHSAAFALAGLFHDVGKADPRFQAWLHGGNARRAEMCGTLYAKSIVPFTSRRELAASRDQAGYPSDARHELASVRLAECAEREGVLPADLDPDQRDLILHLIATHHGHCRPFAPIIEDPKPVPFAYQHNGYSLQFTPDSSLSGHGLERVDSGVAERFWMLTRRYGWWGLPYLEALLRLADWACSEPRETGETTSDGRASAAAAAQEMVS